MSGEEENNDQAKSAPEQNENPDNPVNNPDKSENNPEKNSDLKPKAIDKAALKEQFEAFAKFGDKSADGKTIKLSQSDKWFKQAKVIDVKKLSTTDTGIAFRKISK